MSSEHFATFTEDSFRTDVLERDGLTVVDLWAEWCLPCKQMTKVLRQVAAEIPDSVTIGSLDADQAPGILDRYGVSGLPTLLFFKGGEIVDTMTGVDRKQVIKKRIERHS